MGIARRAWLPHIAMPAPIAAEQTPRTVLSISILRATCQRRAPMARRTPISRWRVVARASTRFAVFPHTARSRISMMPCSIDSPCSKRPCGPLDARQNWTTSARIAALAAGNVEAS